MCIRDSNKIRAYQYNMAGHTQQCIEKYLEVTGVDMESLKKATTPSFQDQQNAQDDDDFEGRSKRSEEITMAWPNEQS